MGIPEPVASRARWLAAACLAFLSGCSLVPKLEAPKLSVMSIKLQSHDIFQQRLQVHMRVLNPNARELPIQGLSYRIEIGETQLAQGLMDTPFVVPALGEAEFDMQVSPNLAGALVQLLSRRASSDTVEYRLVGSVSLSSGLLRRIPFDERGSVKLK